MTTGEEEYKVHLESSSDFSRVFLAPSSADPQVAHSRTEAIPHTGRGSEVQRGEAWWSRWHSWLKAQHQECGSLSYDWIRHQGAHFHLECSLRLSSQDCNSRGCKAPIIKLFLSTDKELKPREVLWLVRGHTAH